MVETRKNNAKNCFIKKGFAKSFTKGFTLVEVLIVIGLLGVSLTLTTGILLSVIKTTRKQEILRNIERGGDDVMRQIEENVRRANSVTEDSNGYLVVQIPKADGTVVTRYFGAVSDLADCTNNYVFMTENSPTEAEIKNLSNRITNSIGNGIKVSVFDPIVYSTQRPTQVFVKLTLESCYDSNVRKEFKTFITARGTYY